MTDTRPWPALALAAALGVALGLGQTRGSYVIEADSTQYLNAARNLAEGNGLVISQVGTDGTPHRLTTWPPLYPLLIALLVKAGASPTPAAWLVSLASFVVVVVLTGMLAAGLAGRAAGLAAATIVSALPGLGLMANSVMSESLFGALALGAVAVLAAEGAAGAGLAGGVLAAGALLTRYVGAVLPAVLAVRMVAEARARRRPATRFLIALLVTALAAGWLARHSFSGPAGGGGERQPSDRTVVANVADYAVGLTRALAGGSLDALKDRGESAAAASVALVVAFLGIGCLLLWRHLAWRDGRVQMLALYCGGYSLLLLALRSFVAFNRLTEARWVVPIVPALVVLLVSAATRGWDDRRVRWWSTAALAVVAIGAAGALAWPPRTGDYGDAGPALAWLRQNYAAGGVIARNAGGRQIAAEATKYQLVHVPSGREAWRSDGELVAAAERYGFRHILLVPRRDPREPPFRREVQGYGAAICRALRGRSAVARVAVDEPRLIVLEVRPSR